MSVELLDKGVSTDDKENGGISNSEFEKLEAILSALVENKRLAIREEKHERRRLFKRFRTRSDGNSVSTISSSPKQTRCMTDGVLPPFNCPPKSFPLQGENVQSHGVRVPPQQSFDSYEASRHSDSCCCSQQLEGKSSSSYVPAKHLTTQEWLNANSRQASTETATTSSGYISPTSGCATLKKTNISEDDDEDTIVPATGVTEISKPCYGWGSVPSPCLPPLPPHHHLHPTGGHYVSCCNSPSHSDTKIQYDDNFLTLAINLEDLEFEREEERRKRRKRRKKRRKERQARARGLMADELKSMNKCRVIDPDDLPKRARWTIVATACVLLLMSLLLVGVTLRMAPIIDDMVRRDNEQRLNSLTRHGTTDFNETSLL